jgi:hypothetical protein
MRNNQLGVTLLELVMSLAIMAGIGYMVMHQQEVSSKAQGKSGFDLEITNIGTHVRHALSDVPSCTQTLSNVVPGIIAGGVVTGGDIPVIFKGIGNDRVANKNLLVVTAEAGKGVLVKQMQLFTDNGQDMVRVTYEATEGAKKTMTGGTVVSKDYFIVGNKDDTNKFTECGAAGLNASDEEVCATIENGTWNTGTKTCDLKDFLKKTDGLLPVYVGGGGEFKVMNSVETSTLTCNCGGSICEDDPNCWCDVGNCPIGQFKENPIRRETHGGQCDMEAKCYTQTAVINEIPIGMLVQP